MIFQRLVMYNYFQLDIKKLVVLLLPTFLRHHKMVAWLHSLITPLIFLYNDFMQQREKHLYRLNHNGQVCYLRKALNDEFDREQRRIRIIDGNQYNREYIYTRAENRPKYLGRMYLRSRSDYEDTGVDFIVEVPKDTYNEIEMKALIDYYKLASKRYKIVKV